MKTSEIGALGEAIACKHVRQLGYRILGQNVRMGHLEIDIIAEKGQKLYFIEVKSTLQSHDGFLFAHLSPVKTKRILKAALQYSIENGYRDSLEMVYLCLEIHLENKSAKVQWIPVSLMDL